MVTLTIDTWINAPVDIVFDLSRSVDLHKYTAADTEEQVIDGVAAGLMDLGQTVTWRAKHFGTFRTLKVKISKIERPHYFTDVMVEGDFKSMKHQHLFKAHDGGTLMRDIFKFEAPFGIVGRLLEQLLLKRYLRNFVIKRNSLLKEIAESGSATRFLSVRPS